MGWEQIQRRQISPLPSPKELQQRSLLLFQPWWKCISTCRNCGSPCRALKFCSSISSEAYCRGLSIWVICTMNGTRFINQRTAAQTYQRGLQWWAWQENCFWNQLKHSSKALGVKNCYCYSSGIRSQRAHAGREWWGTVPMERSSSRSRYLHDLLCLGKNISLAWKQEMMLCSSLLQDEKSIYTHTLVNSS